jgi:hypothetical protein
MELCAGGALDVRLRVAALGTNVRGLTIGEMNEPCMQLPLRWRQRVQVAIDIASALAHLHSLLPSIIHRCVGCALKPSATKHCVVSL